MISLFSVGFASQIRLQYLWFFFPPVNQGVVMSWKAFALVFPLFFVFSVQHASGADQKEHDFFENKIRPLFVNYCHDCHSASKKERGGLLLDSKPSVLKGGDTGQLFVAGKPDESLLMKVVGYDGEIKMPPKSKLSASQIEDLRKWIKDGAYWPVENTVAVKANTFNIDERKKQWAWQPLSKSKSKPLGSNPWVKSSIDAFVLEKMTEKSLVPASPAQKESLIRRAYFDLIGLPPLPADTKAFLQDNSPNAFEKVVNKLLDSSAFGEKWARHWLDLVRYGDSRGHEFDATIPNAFQYRDYVIRAFNADVPYNQFVKEHLAGDLIANPRVHPVEGWNESVLGTGFLYLGEEVHSPVDIRLDQADRFDNRIDVIGKTFLGLTIACARCHDHKFDPIPTKDYYSLFGFLESSHYRLVRFQSLEKNKKVDQKLVELRVGLEPQIKSELSDVLKNIASNFPAYSKAANLGYKLAKTPSAPNSVAQDILLDDFESGTFKGWKVEGNAFGVAPVSSNDLAPEQKDGSFQGKFLVNSYIQKNGQKVVRSDKPTGTLTSLPFLIERDFISFLVGGGGHLGKTCINLLVDGKIEISITGKNLNAMEPASMDVRRFAGRMVAIQIVDQESIGWGHIAVDAIKQTNSVASNDASLLAQGKINKNELEKIALSEKVDPATLVQFFTYLLKADADPKHQDNFFAKKILHPELKSSGNKNPMPVVSDLDFRESFKNKKIIADYSDLPSSNWMPDDFSYGPAPVRLGALRVLGTSPQPEFQFAEYSAAMIDPFWKDLKHAKGAEPEPGSLGANRAGRTLSTPSFYLEDGWVHFLAKGKAKVYASVGAHIMIAGPLHGNLVRTIDMNDWGWVSIDLSRYKSLPAHLEFSSDDLNFAVRLVLQGGQDKPLLPISARENVARSLASLDDQLFHQEIQKSLLELASLMKQEKVVDISKNSNLAAIGNLFINCGLLKINTTAKHPAGNLVDKQNLLRGEVVWDSQLALALREGSGIDEKVFIRGNHKSLGEPAPRSFLTALGGDKLPKENIGSGRLQLAEWITNVEADPFLPRVMVNRIWHHLLGRGIVASVDNFGLLGEKPTHPELLDFLASQFVEDGWSIKKTIKKIMLSSVYQTSSSPSDFAKTNDPDNLFLSHANIKRLSGESIRDAMLLISGELNETMFGPPVNINLSAFQEGRGRPASGPLDGAGRRSIYLSVRRNFLSSFLLAFDSPIPFSTVGKRSISNVPSQALILMNDPFVHQQSEKWAKKIIPQSSDPRIRLDTMFWQALNRPPSSMEIEECMAYLSASPTTATDFEKWASIAHSLWNVKEFVWIP